MNNTFKEVKIGEQIWMYENLNVDTFSNGDKIKQITNIVDWENLVDNSEPAWCYYNFDSNLGEKYGKLYNWFAVTDKRGLSPKGWRIPNLTEWMILIGYAGGGSKDYIIDLIELSNDEDYLSRRLEDFESSFAHKLIQSAEALKSKEGWISGDDLFMTNKPSGTNMSGFNALPAGFLEYTDPDAEFVKLNQSACFWTNTESDEWGEAWAIDFKSSQFYDDGGYRDDSNSIIPLWQCKDTLCGISIRCIKE